MTLNMFLILGFLFIAFLVGAYIIVKKETIFPFMAFDKTESPYIAFTIQGKTFNMLVDTGCAVSLITKEALEGIKYEESKRVANLVALTPDSVPSEMVNVPFMLNNTDYVGEFVVYTLPDLGNFEVKYGITLHGILSSEFFRKAGGIIDYKRQAVIFP